MNKKWVLTIFTVCVWHNLFLSAANPAQFSKELQSDPAFKEAQAFAKVERDKAYEALRVFSNGNHNKSEISSEDFLPKEEKGQVFDQYIAYKKASASRESSQIDISDEEKQLYLNLEQSSLKSKRQEALDGSEKFWGQSESILENPKEEIGIDFEEEVVSEEENLKTCQEGADYQTFINLSRNIQVFPAEKKRTKFCKGHEKQEVLSKKNKAEEYKQKEETRLRQDPSIGSYSVAMGDVLFGYRVIIKHSHKENTPGCDSFYWKEEEVWAGFQKETWDADNPENFSTILGNPNCTLIAEQIVQGPETKIIDGVPYHRDVWVKKLMFSCTECDNSGCQELRKLGGRVVKKKCLSELSTGECVLWEKTYDMGGRAKYSQTKSLFDGEEIFGFEGWDSSYEKNNEIGETLTTFSSFTDIKREMEENPERPFDGNSIEIFKGEKHRCQCTFLDGVFLIEIPTFILSFIPAIIRS